MIDFLIHNRLQVFTIIGSLVFLIIIFELVRRKKVKEEYSLLSIFAGIFFVVIAIWKDLLTIISSFLGIYYPPSVFLVIFIIFIFLILLQYSVATSKLTEQNKTLIQEVGILKMEIEELRKKVDKMGKE